MEQQDEHYLHLVIGQDKMVKWMKSTKISSFKNLMRITLTRITRSWIRTDIMVVVLTLDLELFPEIVYRKGKHIWAPRYQFVSDHKDIGHIQYIKVHNILSGHSTDLGRLQWYQTKPFKGLVMIKERPRSILCPD